MSSTGELNQRARRPSTPGANTQILFNNNGVDGANGILTLDTGNNGVFAVGGNVTAAVGNSVAFLNSTNGSQLLLQSRGTYYGSISNPNNQVWSLGYSTTVSNTMPTGNVLQWSITPYVAISGDGSVIAPSGAYGTGAGRGALIVQGGGSSKDAIIAFQNTTNVLTGYLYSSNITTDLYGVVKATIYGGGVLTITTTANQVNVSGSMNVTATGGGGTKVLEVNGANSSGPLCVFDSGGNFGTYMSYRANSADIAFIGSGNRVFASRNNDFAIAAVNVGGNLMLGVGSTCYVNLTAAQMNVAGSLNVTSSINTATFNASGIMAAAGSPQTNNQTRAVTGLAAISQSGMAITSNTTLSTDLNLQCTINETGVYKIDGWMGFYHTTSAIANLKITLGGTATINNMMMGMMCSSGVAGAANLVQSNTATAGNTGLSAANANVQIANITSITQNQPDFVVLSGILVANGTGTLFPMWAQAVSATSAMNRSANSYFKLTKIG